MRPLTTRCDSQRQVNLRSTHVPFQRRNVRQSQIPNMRLIWPMMRLGHILKFSLERHLYHIARYLVSIAAPLLFRLLSTLPVIRSVLTCISYHNACVGVNAQAWEYGKTLCDPPSLSPVAALRLS